MPEQPFPVQLDLLERDAELTAVTGLIAASPGGGRLLAIEGPPGIGKTALMMEAKALAQEAGMQVLGGRGSDLERSFSYGVVRQLFEPLLASLQADERADLLAGSAALAAPLFDPAQVAAEPAADSSLATLHGLYWLTANLAARRPLLLALDDLHWCDLPSLRWLAYLLPRMEGLGLLVLVGLRPAEPGEDPGLIGQIVSDPLATTVRPAPLSTEAVARLLRESLSPEADDAFCAACQEATGGNPLLLRELVHAIAAEGLAPTEENVPRLREIEARAGSRAVSLAPLSAPAGGDDARAGRRDPGRRRRSRAKRQRWRDLDEQAASEAAARARAGRRPSPAAAARVRPSADPRGGLRGRSHRSSETDGHARAARLLANAGAEPERVAAHLLRSPPAADPQAVATLRDAARRAGSRGASESAVAYLRRALEEPPPDAERAEVLLELGAAEAHVSGEAAIEHLREAHALAASPVRRAEAARLLGGQLFVLRGEEADAVLQEALDELAGADPELERFLAAGLITNGLFAPGLHRDAAQRLERVRVEPRAGTAGEKLLLSLLAYHDARAGRPAAEVVPLARKALADGTILRADQPAVPYPVGAGLVPTSTVLAMADLDEVLTVYEDALAEAHRHGSTLAFGAVKVFRAFALRWRGDLGEVEAEAREALAAGEVWGATARFARHAAAFLADSLMEQGRLDEAAAVLAGAWPGEAPPGSTRLLFLGDSARRLRLLRGDLAGGLEEMLEAGRLFEEVGSRNPAFIAWRSPAALALLQLGRRDEAGPLAEEEVELARTWGAPRALGAALRAAGLVEGGERGLELLVEAVDVLSGSPARLEHAKARTELGAALRRANRRAEAREQLRQATRAGDDLRRRARSPHAPRASSSPPARARGASP